MKQQFSATEKHREVCRELDKRRYVYPKLVANGKLTQRTADRQIAVMEQVAEEYRVLAEKEKLL